ncbi:NAD(P)/FAD-dependent oxidoreductase [Maribacter polysiphoniae]|uniref:NAD(P)/FAD-dependent oxidoreductase n=1 Tax=Maribacter polysiphoniae TaxID=429344 RepID=UPI002357E9F8|nr:FAD-binding oxidoreductase [Maribacter polysiphoniae]
MIDYLVVGLGLAGVSFCEQLEAHKKDYKVITDNSQTSSLVAGGLYNPVILKRFTLAWNADTQLEKAIPFYKGLERKLGTRLDYKISILRKFASIAEQNLWFEAADKKRLHKFLDTMLIENKDRSIDAPFGFGKVLHTGRIDVKTLIGAYQNDLVEKGRLLQETFDFSSLQIHNGHVEYKSIKARKIVFATGFGLKSNPYFNYLPLQGSKGELLTIKAPDIKTVDIIKSSVFIIPMGNDLYRVGATYERLDKSNNPTDGAKNELLSKLHTFLKCDYEIVDHVAGIRPTVSDRRPLVGSHPEYDQMYVLNGFGSRGVLIAPTVSAQLFDYIEKGEALPREIDVLRFIKKYTPKVS